VGVWKSYIVSSVGLSASVADVTVSCMRHAKDVGYIVVYFKI